MSRPEDVVREALDLSQRHLCFHERREPWQSAPAALDELVRERDDALQLLYKPAEYASRLSAAEARAQELETALREIEEAANNHLARGHIGFLARRALASGEPTL